MAQMGDLIDFSTIEGQKENIEALPSGRSAKALAQRFSPLNVASPAETQDVHTTARQQFEAEIAAIEDSDDPLDVYDRYVRWTLEAYPTASATPQSGLLPLLERATKVFIKDDTYKNDARYLKLWLSYIRLFADAPRESFAYLARHGVGSALALYYEEFAAWLENAGRINQAEEIYKLGIERQARPTERLLRKFGEFERRAISRPQDPEQPSSPALPALRAALVTKTDPFTASSPETADPQAADRARARNATTNTRKQKMQIFADTEEPENSASGNSTTGWDEHGTLADRKKENTRSAQPWNGEKLASGSKQNAGMPKMTIFKDESTKLPMHENISTNPISTSASTTNPRSGRAERVFVSLELVYPNPEDPSEEYCFEEIRACSRGWLQRDWRAQEDDQQLRSKPQRPKLPASETTTTLVPLAGAESSDDEKLARQTDQRLMLNDENNLASSSQESEREALRRMRREERANKTRKIKVRESRAETQTIQANLDSPQGPRLKRKKSSEPTMTVHTKAATDEVYELFNQSMSDTEEHSDNNESSDESEDDGYTTGGESTATGRISGNTSEIGEDTQKEIGEDASESDAATDAETTRDDTGWSEFTTSKHMPKTDDDDASVTSENDVSVDTNVEVAAEASDERPSLEIEKEDNVVTPTSPVAAATDVGSLFVPVPPEDYRAPTRPYRDAAQVAMNRLPFMTPIVEKTESSLGTLTRNEKDYFNSKTPCPKASSRTPQIAEDSEEVEVWSSPFQDDIVLKETQRHNIQAREPAPKLKIHSSPKVARPVQRSTKEASKGPIIKDVQCNPMAPEVHETILSEMQPPLSSYEGFFDRRHEAYNRKLEIQKYCRSVAHVRSKSGTEKTLSTPTVPPMLDFEGTNRRYAIKKELGVGAFAPVYLTEELSEQGTEDQQSANEQAAKMGHGTFSLNRSPLQALKMEHPSSAWEFYMLRCAHRRLGLTRPSQSIIQAYEMHLFRDEGYLFEEYRDQGTLLDFVNVIAEQNRIAGSHAPGMDEALAMFFTIEILRTIEALHAKSIIHGDLKADNLLVRFAQPDTPDSELDPQYHRDGSAGWSSKGITLIDFGRGIDMRAFMPSVQFIADWETSQTDCAEMRELRTWTYQADYHGVAAIVHTMLFGKYIETIAEKGAIGPGAGSARTYRLKEGLKRWWQTELWGELFGLLLNPTRKLEREEGQRLPCLRGMKECRERMESWVEANCEKGAGLRNLIRRLEGVVGARRKA